jgi:hypothetical protein
VSDELWDVPYKFEDGETLDPERINANILHIQKMLRAVKAKRYSYYDLTYPIGELAAASGGTPDTQEEGRFYVRCPWVYEVTGATLALETDNADTYTVTSNIPGWREFSVTTADGEKALAGASQTCQAADDTQYYFQVSLPTTSAKLIKGGTLTIRCRYDALSGVSLPTTVPQVRSEAPSATELNAYFTAVASTITQLSSAISGYGVRKRAMVAAMFRNPSNGNRAYVPNISLSGVTYDIYNLHSNSSDITVTARDTQNAQNLFSEVRAGSNGRALGDTDANDGLGPPTNDFQGAATDGPIYFNVSAASGTMYRVYIILYANG